MKKSIQSLIGVALVAIFLTGCGQVVEVPPAHVAKKSTPSGLQEGIIPPSKIRLPFCFFPGQICQNLILSEAPDYGVKEEMTIFMPKDKLNLTVDVRGVFSISSDESNVEKIFSRITAESIDDRVSIIRMTRVYKTYGAPVVRSAVRSVIRKYSIMEVMENSENISQELAKVVREKLKTTPISTIRFGLADLQPPKVIVDAQEAATKREIEIRQAEANKLVLLKEAEAALEVAYKQQEVDLKEAETQVLVAKKLAEGVSPAWIAQRGIKAIEKLENGNHVILMPTEAFNNPAVMMGVMNKSLSRAPMQGGQ